jgi:hypothetical protein
LSEEIKIRITADASDLNAGTVEASAAVDRMGSRFETAAISTGRMETSMVHLTSHMIGHAIPGMGRMALMMGRMGESAIGAAPLLEALIPIAVLVAGVEVMNKVEEAELKIAQEAEETAVETSKWNDKVEESKERLVGLTQGPLAEAILKMDEFKNKTSELSDVTKISNKAIEANSHWYNNLAAEVERAGIATSNFLAMRSDSKPYDNAAAQKELADIGAKYTATKDLAQATRELNALVARVEKAGGPDTETIVGGVQAGFAVLSDEMKKNANDQKSLTAEVAKDKKEALDKEIKAHEENMKKQIEFAKEYRKAEQELAFESVKESQKTAEREARENAEVRKSWEAQLAKDKTEINKAANRAIEEDLKKIRQGTETGVVAAKGSDSGKIAIYEAQEAALDKLMQQTQALQAAEADPEQAAQLGAVLEQELELQQQYADKVAELQQKIQEGQSRMFDKMTGAFQSNLLSWEQGHERFGRAMEKTWMSVANQAVSSLQKVALQEAIGLALHMKIGDQIKLGKAKEAARGAFSSVMNSAVPFPLNVILAPLAAGAAFTAVEAFDQGGIASGGLAQLHTNEMVLPPHISDFIQKAAANAPSEGGGDTNHFNYSPNVSALDHNGVEDVLKSHSDALYTMWQQENRRRNYG